MKLNLFLLSLLAVLYASKAGPLRLHKRAAFYIANETACVVDNIVYSNGDPIPTDDPCESCKCRPPGFACVLKECQVKPGCKAVRRDGYCCPEYICGCEHNGRTYRDGDEIRDPKNPCYTCHCQGTSIACAFVDCFFRLDCIPMYDPGECCPSYRNCTGDNEDNPSKETFPENNVLPPLNLLPVLNDESVLPGELPSVTQAPVSSEQQTDPPQSTPVIGEVNSVASEGKEDTDESSKVQTTESTVPVTEELKISDPGTEEKNNENDTPNEEDPKETSSTDKKEVVGTKVLFNSETEIKTDDESTEATTVKEVTEEDKSTKVSDPVESEVQEVREAETQTTAGETEAVENKAETTTEKQSETESTSTFVPPTEKPVKNSAADNSKSLKLLGDEKDTSDISGSNEEPAKEETKVSDPEKPEKTSSETEKVADTPTEEVSSKTEADDTKVDDSTESKTDSEENVAEESQSDPQIALFYNQDDKVVKKESAETVTIVVHVREKTKPPTETDFETEKVTPESSTDATQVSLLKSSDDLQNSEKSEAPTSVEGNTSTDKNFEAFPDSSTKVNKDESATKSPITDEKVEERSEETDSTVSVDEKQITGSDSKSDDLPVTTTQTVTDDHSESDKEARANEEIVEEKKEVSLVTDNCVTESKTTEVPVEEPKVSEITADEPKVTEIKIEQPNAAINIKTISDSGEQDPKVEESKTEDPKEEETVESKPEERSSETGTEEKVEETESENKVEESNSEDKVGEIKTEEEKSEPQGNTEERKPEERSDDGEEKAEVASESSVESSKPEEKQEQKPEGTTKQVTEVPKQTETPSASE